MRQYAQSLPGQACRYWFAACLNATNNDTTLQNNCVQARNSECGKLPAARLGTSSSRIASPTATRSPTSRPSTTFSSEKKELSAGAKVGIAVGAMVAVFFLIPLLWMCSQRRKRAEEREIELVAPGYEVAHVDDSSVPWVPPKGGQYDPATGHHTYVDMETSLPPYTPGQYKPQTPQSFRPVPPSGSVNNPS
jgi:hypothetical protein